MYLNVFLFLKLTRILNIYFFYFLYKNKVFDKTLQKRSTLVSLVGIDKKKLVEKYWEMCDAQI